MNISLRKLLLVLFAAFIAVVFYALAGLPQLGATEIVKLFFAFVGFGLVIEFVSITD